MDGPHKQGWASASHLLSAFASVAHLQNSVDPCQCKRNKLSTSVSAQINPISIIWQEIVVPRTLRATHTISVYFPDFLLSLHMGRRGISLFWYVCVWSVSVFVYVCVFLHVGVCRSVYIEVRY